MGTDPLLDPYFESDCSFSKQIAFKRSGPGHSQHPTPPEGRCLTLDLEVCKLWKVHLGKTCFFTEVFSFSNRKAVVGNICTSCVKTIRSVVPKASFSTTPTLIQKDLKLFQWTSTIPIILPLMVLFLSN